MGRALLVLTSFTLARDGIDLFEPIALQVEAGDVVSLRGENGVGKSTLLRHLAGLRRSGITARGEACVLGLREELSVTQRARAGVMLVRQVPTAYTNLTVREQLVTAAMPEAGLWRELVLPLAGSGRSRRRRVADEAAEMFGLSRAADERVGSLSLGQLRLVALASAAVRLSVGRLRLLLLDEPTSGLAEDGRTALAGLLQWARTGGCGVLLSEHVGDGTLTVGSRPTWLRAPGGVR